MKICFLSKEYPPETRRGGIGSHVYLIANELAKEHEVHVITETSDKGKSYVENNVIVHRIKPQIIHIPIINRILGNVAERFCYNWQIYKKLKSLDVGFDIIQASDFSFEGLLPSFNSKYNLITRISLPIYLYDLNNFGKSNFQNRITSLLERWQTKRSKVILSQSKFMTRIISREWDIPEERIRIMPNPVKKIENMKIKNKFGNYILYFGAINRLKGINVILKALPGVFESYPKLKMIFIGKDDGGYAAKFKAFGDRIVHLGYLEQKELLSYASNARLVVLPSLFENCSNSCLEAMSLGKAVIATKKTGFEEQIENNKSGFLVEPGNASELRDKILECLRRKDLEKIGENAKKRTIKLFSLESYTKKLVEIYEEILEIK